MPLYDYECKNCKKQFSKQLKIVERKNPLKENCPSCDKENSIIQIFISTGRNSKHIIDPIQLGIKKPSGAFKEVMENIRENCPGVKGTSGMGKYF